MEIYIMFGYESYKKRFDCTLTRKDIDMQTYHYHHTGSDWGYVSRKLAQKDYPAREYHGRYGDGYVVYAPRWDTSYYCYLHYYIKDADK